MNFYTPVGAFVCVGSEVGEIVGKADRKMLNQDSQNCKRKVKDLLE